MHELYECERKPKTKITKNTCISRQKIIHSEKKLTGQRKIQYNDIKNTCEGCPKGIELYVKSLTGDQDMDEKAKKCIECGIVKPLNSESFDKSEASADGFFDICNSCYVGDNKKSLEDEIDEITEEILLPGAAVVYHPPETNRIIKLDLTKEPELLEKIEKWSAKNRRCASDQILWHIEEHLSLKAVKGS